MAIHDHLDKLKLFTSVVERGSINGASKDLSLSQPAVTRAIQTLESAVGFSLFNRDRHGMHLTEGGRVFHETAIRVLKEIADAAIRGGNAQEEMAGNLTIGTYETLAEYLWPDFLSKIQTEFPLLNISLKTNSQAAHLAELNSGVLDLLVDAEPRSYTGLTMWLLYSDRFNFYSRQKVDLAPESARSCSLLSVRGVFDENNITLEQHLLLSGYRFQREYTFDSFIAVKRMAEKGLGVAILPQRLAESDNRLYQLNVKGLKSGFGPHKIYAAVSPRRENDQRVKTIIKLLKRQLASLS